MKAVCGEYRRCIRCGAMMRLDELNEEAFIHHGAHGLECKDRKACGRRKWKNERRERR